MQVSTLVESNRQAALSAHPGRLKRVVDYAYALGEAATDYEDAADAIEDVLWADGRMPCETRGQKLAWRLAHERAMDAHRRGWNEVALPRIVEKHRAVHGDVWRVAYEVAWECDDSVRADVIADAVGIPVGKPWCPIRKAFADRAAGNEQTHRDNLLEAAVDAQEKLATEASDAPAVEILANDDAGVAALIFGASERHVRRNQIREAILAIDEGPEPDPVSSPASDFQPTIDLRNPDAWTAGRLPNLLQSMRYDRAAEVAPPSWLIKNVLPRDALGLLYAESSSGKTFLAVHLALSVAFGVPFFGNRTKRGGVAYIAAEAGRSVVRRFKAAEDEFLMASTVTGLVGGKGLPPRAPIEIVTEAPNLARDGRPDRLANTIRQCARDFEQNGERLALVVLDTYHAMLAGADENSSADTGLALKPIREAVEELGLCALLVHHPGKDVERGARGSSSLTAAVDTSIELRVPGFDGPKKKPPLAPRCATIIKQRDGEVGGEFHFRLNKVTVGKDEDGDPLTTCTVHACDAPTVATGALTDYQRQLIEAVQGAVAEGENGRGKLETARLAFRNRQKGKSDATARKAWSRTLEWAVDTGRVLTDKHDLWIWIPEEPASACDM